jgi:sugar lactone lactonase YvrE
MRTLFITTTRENMSDEGQAQYPLSGAIFTLSVDVEGIAATRFAG